MGWNEDPNDAIGFASAIGDEGDEEPPLNVARGWAGLTSQGKILISIEQLARGTDVEVVVAHETAHDVLLQSTVFGVQQMALSMFAMPPWPPGALQRIARRVLAASVAGSVRTQEGCATFLPSLGRDTDALDVYWATFPASYREFASPLEWLRGRALPAAMLRRVVFALGQFALGVRIPKESLGDAAGVRSFVGDATQCPDERFLRACAAIAGLTDDELTEVADDADPAEAVAKRLPDGVTACEPTLQPGERWLTAWERSVEEAAEIWSAKPRVTDDERAQAQEWAGNAMMLLPPPSPSVLKAVLTRTVSLHGGVAEHPPVASLLGYQHISFSYNPFDQPVPGIELTSGGGSALAPGEAAVWLASPQLPDRAARLSEAELRALLAQVPADTTLCTYDAGYMFPDGDLLAAEPILRNRAHLVLVQQRSLGALLGDPLFNMGLSGGERVRYTMVGGETPGAAYFLIAPDDKLYPVVIVPVPWPAAERAAQQVKGSTTGGLQWIEVEPEQFMRDDLFLVRHLLRTFAWYEDKDWPSGTERPIEPAADTEEGRDISDLAGQLGPPPRSKDFGGDALRFLGPAVRARLDAAGGLEASGELQEAENGYLGMMAQDDTSTRTAGAIALGMLKLHQGDLDGAIAAFGIAGTSADPDLGPFSMLLLGQALQARGDGVEAARAFFTAASSGHPQHAPPAALCLARLLASVPDTVDDAIPLFRWVVASEHPDVAALAAADLASVTDQHTS